MDSIPITATKDKSTIEVVDSLQDIAVAIVDQDKSQLTGMAEVK